MDQRTFRLPPIIPRENLKTSYSYLLKTASKGIPFVLVIIPFKELSRVLKAHDHMRQMHDEDKLVRHISIATTVDTHIFWLSRSETKKQLHNWSALARKIATWGYSTAVDCAMQPAYHLYGKELQSLMAVDARAPALAIGIDNVFVSAVRLGGLIQTKGIPIETVREHCTNGRLGLWDKDADKYFAGKDVEISDGR